MQYNLFYEMLNDKIKFEELLQAYYDCRSNKRFTANALAFELNYESELIKLLDEINTGVYQPGRSIAFIVHKPVQREIFAADFRDRIVHHLIINKLNHLFERKFIYDSYSCRIGKGTHFAIKRVDRFIRKCSKNYTEDSYVLKLDIQGFFMHINKHILHDKLTNFIERNYHLNDKSIILQLIRKIVFNSPTKGCIIKGCKSNWRSLPRNKSLFHANKGVGLPIGNLTSQVFANFYMDAFDHFIKHDLAIKYYGRYVDDFVIVHHSKRFLQDVIPKISRFLYSTLNLKIHPRKIYLQHIKKGVQFVGAVIKPNRIYIANRTKGNMYDAVAKFNTIARTQKIKPKNVDALLCSLNSYLGIMKHYSNYRIRKSVLRDNLNPLWFNYVFLNGIGSKLVKKQVRAKTVVHTNYNIRYWDYSFEI